MKNRSCDKCLKTLERVKGFPRGHIGLLPRYVLVRNSGCYLIAASSNNLVKAGYATQPAQILRMHARATN
jgi:hypothetical protein